MWCLHKCNTGGRWTGLQAKDSGVWLMAGGAVVGDRKPWQNSCVEKSESNESQCEMLQVPSSWRRSFTGSPTGVGEQEVRGSRGWLFQKSENRSRGDMTEEQGQGGKDEARENRMCGKKLKR